MKLPLPVRILLIFLYLSLSNCLARLEKDPFSSFSFLLNLLGLNGSNSATLIQSFTITGSLNDLSRDYSGTISGTNITINLPYGKAPGAIPTLTSNASTITVGGNPFISGVTTVNFTSTVSFVASSSDGTSQTFTVIPFLITPIEDTGQTTCYDNSSVQTCAAVSASHPRQDAMIADFPNAKGLQLPTVNSGYSSDYITKNTLTGIVWNTVHKREYSSRWK